MHARATEDNLYLSIDYQWAMLVGGSSLIPERAVLTIIVWGLILEVMVIVYFWGSSQTGRFEFAYTLFLFAITLTALIFMLASLYRRAQKLRL